MLKPGQQVWYRPSLNDPTRYAAVVDCEPFALGHGEMVVHLRDVQGYTRTRITAASVRFLSPREIGGGE